ncbi:unnamed protein product, partial [Polarella glacialis]
MPQTCSRSNSAGSTRDSVSSDPRPPRLSAPSPRAMTDVVFNAFSELDSLLQAAQARSYRRRSQSAQAVLLRQPFETKTSVSEWLHEHGKCKPCAYQGLCRRGKG